MGFHADGNFPSLLTVKVASIPTLALLLAVPWLDGCRRKKVETTAPAQPAAAAANPVAPAPPADFRTDGPAGRRTEPPPVVYQVDATVQQALSKFYNDHERPAMTWEELVRGRYIPAIPLGPDGKPLDWNSTMQRIGKAMARPRQ